MSISKINHTQISNEFLDKYMSIVSGNSVKIFLVICRNTIGWQKDIDKISQTQIAEKTGLTINTIKKSIDELLKYDLIIVKKTGSGKAIQTEYSIKYVSKIDINQANNISNFDIKNDDNVSKIDTKSENNISNFDTTKENNINKSINIYTVAEFNNAVNEIISIYPDKCPFKQIRLYPNSKDNIKKIKKLLIKYSKEEIIKRINTYKKECMNSNTWFKSFKNFLDILPEIDTKNKSSPDNTKTNTPIFKIEGVE